MLPYSPNELGSEYGNHCLVYFHFMEGARKFNRWFENGKGSLLGIYSGTIPPRLAVNRMTALGQKRTFGY